MSFWTLLSVLITLPRYVNSLVCSSGSPSMLIGLDASQLTHNFGFLFADDQSRFLGTCVEIVWSILKMSRRWRKDAMSSAKSRSWRWGKIIHCIPQERREIVWRITQSIVTRKSTGESIQQYTYTYNLQDRAYPQLAKANLGGQCLESWATKIF